MIIFPIHTILIGAVDIHRIHIKNTSNPSSLDFGIVFDLIWDACLFNNGVKV